MDIKQLTSGCPEKLELKLQASLLFLAVSQSMTGVFEPFSKQTVANSSLVTGTWTRARFIGACV